MQKKKVQAVISKEQPFMPCVLLLHAHQVSYRKHVGVELFMFHQNHFSQEGVIFPYFVAEFMTESYH